MSEMGPITKKLYDTLTGIQMGRIEAPEGWIHVIKQFGYKQVIVSINLENRQKEERDWVTMHRQRI